MTVPTVTHRDVDDKYATGVPKTKKIRKYASATCNPTCIAVPNSKSGLACNDTTLECLYGCHQGYGGERCQFRCDHSCVNCTTDSCNGDCNATCDNIICNQTETCIKGCLGGFYGQNCTLPCPNHCLNSTCGRENGTCLLGCETDFFGDTCARTCSPNCAETPPETANGTCNVTTLACLYGCKDNFDGDQCDTCERGWTGIHCNVSCNYNCMDCTPDGGCDRCYPGYYMAFKFCEACRSGCYRNSSFPACDQVDGECILGCIPGRYGKKCSSWCSSLCINSVCGRSDGCCTEGCRYSISGGCHCSEPCSRNCRDGTCYQNKTCMEGCVLNHWGPDCNQKCSDSCAQGENKSAFACDRNGVCVFGCDKTFMGQNCLGRCPDNCVERDCHMASGQCLQGCEKGYWSKHCNSRCNINCLDADCAYETGFCRQGCINGFHGRFCSRDCPINCLNSSCFQENGTCSKGCLKGLSGEKCNYVEDSAPKVSSTSSLEAILDPVLYTFAALVVVGMTLVLIYIKRKKVIKCYRETVKCFSRQTTDVPPDIYMYENSATLDESEQHVQSMNTNLPISENAYEKLQERSMNADHSYGELKSSCAGHMTPRTSTNTNLYDSEETATGDMFYEELQKQKMTDNHFYGDATESSVETDTCIEASNSPENAGVYQPLQIQTGTTGHIYAELEGSDHGQMDHTTEVSENKSSNKAKTGQEKAYENLKVRP